MTWLPHTTVATLVENDGTFLMVEEDDNGRTVFNQPAGHLDPGENLVQAAVRETLEETGWQPGPITPMLRYHPSSGSTDQVFHIFSTLKRRDEVEGSGMGLAFVRKLVAQQGGQVTIEPNEPRGTAVVFTWPDEAPV